MKHTPRGMKKKNGITQSKWSMTSLCLSDTIFELKYPVLECMRSTSLIETVVFSYNRGALLCNCASSVKTFMPGVRLTVFDDMSTDSDTRVALRELRGEGSAIIEAMPPETKQSPASAKTGGLHHNMQTFLYHHASSEWVLFLQDDTQLVRRFTKEDAQTITDIFSTFPQAAFIYPAFLTHRSYYSSFIDNSSVLGTKPSFAFSYDYEFSGYFDVCIANVARLKANRWNFRDELSNSLLARELFGPMRIMRYPFVAHLPSPPTFHNRNRTWTQGVWEFFRTGLYPIDSISESGLRKLVAMSDEFPSAEEFLRSDTFWGSHPWPYSRLEGAPPWLHTIEKLERSIRMKMRVLLS